MTQEEIMKLVSEAYYKGMEDAAKILLEVVKDKRPDAENNRPGVE